MVRANKPVRVDIWHNIMWSAYKAVVFSALNRHVELSSFAVKFFQIAETEFNRLSLNEVDYSRHNYPVTLVFEGAYESVAPVTMLSKLALHALRTDAELVVLAGYSRPEYWLQLFVLKLRRKTVAVFCDSTINDRRQLWIKTFLKRIFFKTVDGVFCYGERSREYLKMMGAREETIFTRCQACAIADDYSPEKTIENRIAATSVLTVPRFLFVGRLSAAKDLETLLMAFAIVRRERPAELELVGQGEDLEKLKRLALELNIEDSVHFHGTKSGAALDQEYLRATCLVLPSISEPWGLVVNEALAQGCPVIVSDSCGCVPELIEADTGLSFVTGDQFDLAAKMRRLITEFSDVPRIAYACVTHIAMYNPDNAADQILRGIESLLKQHKN